MTARHHHYLSQCYLKGFTRNGSKKSKLSVFDLKQRKTFITIPRNVGGIRDFNRVEVDGVDPNIVEKSYADFEGKAATALKHIERSFKFEGENKEYILNLIAMLAIRSPEQRENWRQFHAQIAERIMDLTLVSKERWESQKAKMKQNGYGGSDEISYEDIKAFHESKQYKIEIAKERHIEMEMKGIETILPCLDGRNWLLIHATKDSGQFITTDNPVNLTWNDPESIPPFYRHSPGFGMKSTQVYFPLSRNVGLIGEFGGKQGVLPVNKDLVAVLNSKMLMFAYKQVYAPTAQFPFLSRDGSIMVGTGIFKEMDKLA